jgi:thymidylate synthase (FAD)
VKLKVLDKGYVELLSINGNDETITDAARVSYAGKRKTTDENNKLLRYLWDNGHLSPFEQVQTRFRVKLPLFVARQWMRHRTFSYNEISRRYTSVDLDFYIPHYWRTQHQTNKQSSEISDFKHVQFSQHLRKHCERSLESYNYLLSNSVSREMARMVLPVNLYTTFVCSVNIRNLLHFLDLRLHTHAQWEIQQYAVAILRILRNKLPETSKIFEESLSDEHNT